MEDKVKILFVGDSPGMPTGLARIARDLATRVAKMEGYEVWFLGLNYTPPKLRYDEIAPRVDTRFGFQIARMEDTENWGAGDIAKLCMRSALEGISKPDVIFTIYDPHRMVGVAKIADLFRIPLWGYFPIDSYGPKGTIGGPARFALDKYQRVLAYNPFGRDVLQASGVPCKWLPHGLEEKWFTNEVDFKDFNSYSIPNSWFEKDVRMGVVATNQPRKDLATAFESAALLKARLEKQGKSFALWLHTDLEIDYWSIPQLCEDFDFEGEDVLVSTSLSDNALKVMYSNCTFTFGPGLGEGFGYPLAESLACGTPAIHVNFAGGATVVPNPNWLTEPTGYRYEGTYCQSRPLLNPSELVGIYEWVLDEVNRNEIAVESFCKLSVSNLKWSNVWPRWEGWFLAGLAELKE